MQTGIDTSRLYFDMSGLDKLKLDAKNQTDSAKHEVAQQFEALFIQTMLKNMRAASIGDSLTNSDQVELYQEMMDKQLSVSMAKAGGIGLADMIEKQLNQANVSTTNPTKKDVHAAKIDQTLAFATHLWTNDVVTRPSNLQIYKSLLPHDENNIASSWESPGKFVQSLMPFAEQAAQKLNTQPEAILAIAALETGWGKHVISRANGQSSFNFFGIKATGSEKGGRIYTNTTEYSQGLKYEVNQAFRTYNSPQASVEDFANFILDNPRYSKALKQASHSETFIREIQKAGYATDPEYANKVIAVMASIRNITQDAVTIADNSL